MAPKVKVDISANKVMVSALLISYKKKEISKTIIISVY